MSIIADKVDEAAILFCRNCDNLSPPNMELPKGRGEMTGRVCDLSFMGASGMLERHNAGQCGLAMVEGVSGTMTLDGFVSEEEGDTTA